MSDYLGLLKRAANEMKSGNPLYVPRRVSYSLRRRLVDWRFSSNGPSRKSHCFGPNIPEDPTQLIEYFRSRKAPMFHFQADEIGDIVSQIPQEEKAKTIESAGDFAQRRFAFRGSEPILLNPVNWEFVPENHAGWRRDLNRHFYFTQIGFAYWYTKDSRFVQAFVDLSCSWIEQNANRIGALRWDDPFELAARINAWIWAYFLFLYCAEWDPPRHKQFLNTLGRLCEYLHQVIEYHRPGNHILLEAKALAMCSGLFPEFKGAQLWWKKAWSILTREIRAQVCDDGVHAERSTMYHRIVAGELAEFLLYCRRNHVPDANDLAETVQKMADFETCITTDNGSVPLIGDAYAKDSYFRFSAPVIVASFSDNNDSGLSFLRSADQTVWALGRRKRQAEGNSFPNSLRGEVSKDFSEGGYFVSRSNVEDEASVLVWDCGPVGYKNNLYHSHLDTLSLFLAVKGVPILIDPGTDDSDSGTRRYLCGTAAHNTVQIDGQHQSILGKGNTIWAPARANLIFWGTMPECDVMMGSHNGYLRLSDPVLHTRTIISMKNHYWLIFDRVEGKGWHKAERRFHLAPGATVKWACNDRQLSIEKGEIALSFITMPVLTAGEEQGCQQTEIEEGFAELECGRRESISVINTVVNGLVPFSMSALLVPEASETRKRPIHFLDLGHQWDVHGIEIQGLSVRDKIFFRAGERRQYKVLAGIETDSKVIILRFGKDDVPLSAFVIDASTLVSNSLEYLKTSGLGRLQKIVFKESELFP